MLLLTSDTLADQYTSDHYPTEILVLYLRPFSASLRWSFVETLCSAVLMSPFLNWERS
jgi:hypothetical protein